jgi:hypothetical protein
MNRDIENLKEEITSKDQQLVKEHFDSKKVLCAPTARVSRATWCRRGPAPRTCARTAKSPRRLSRARVRACRGVPPRAGVAVGRAPLPDRVP